MSLPIAIAATSISPRATIPRPSPTTAPSIDLVADAKAYYNRGVAYTAINKLDEAVEDYTAAIKLDPKDPSGYFNRGVVLHRQGKTAQGISDLDEAIRLDENDPSGPLNRGLLFLSLGFHDKALADFDHTIALDAKNVDAYINRGYTLHSQGQYDLAIKDFTKAIEISPETPWRIAIAAIPLPRTRVRPGHADLDHAIELEPGQAQFYNNRGTVHGDQNDHSKAIADFSKAIELQPKFASALGNRGPSIISSATRPRPVPTSWPPWKSIPIDQRAFLKNIARSRRRRLAATRQPAASRFAGASRLNKHFPNHIPLFSPTSPWLKVIWSKILSINRVRVRCVQVVALLLLVKGASS